MRRPLTALCALFAALVGAGLAARPAEAQCRLCDTPTVTAPDADSVTPLEISVDSDLNFDRLLLEREGEGTARLTPSGDRSASGSIGSIGGRAGVARIVVRGAPGRPVTVRLPDRIELYGLKGGTIAIESIVSDLDANPTLDSTGQLIIQLGGEVRISGDADGEYRGDVPIAVDYL